MKSTALTCAIAAASLGLASLSYAQDHHRGDRDGRYAERRGYASQDGRSVERRDSRQGWQNGQQQPRQYDSQRQYERQGQQPQYSQRQYYVNDWRAHHLYAPPYGYQWVQADGGDYLLVALATGLIANLLLNQ